MKILVLLLLSALPAAADMSGLWTLSGQFLGKPVKTVCSLTDEGGGLQGTCQFPDQQAVPASGQTDETNANWISSYVLNGTAVDVQFKGVLNSDTAMSGTWKVNGSESAFTATKQP